MPATRFLLPNYLSPENSCGSVRRFRRPDGSSRFVKNQPPTQTYPNLSAPTNAKRHIEPLALIHSYSKCLWRSVGWRWRWWKATSEVMNVGIWNIIFDTQMPCQDPTFNPRVSVGNIYHGVNISRTLRYPWIGWKIAMSHHRLLYQFSFIDNQPQLHKFSRNCVLPNLAVASHKACHLHEAIQKKWNRTDLSLPWRMNEWLLWQRKPDRMHSI